MAVREQAHAGLDVSWERPLDAWQIVTKTERAIAFETDDEAVEWFLGALDELKAVGMFELIPTLGTGVPGEGPDGPNEAPDLTDGDELIREP